MADMKFLDTIEEVLLERGFPLDIVQKVLETAQTIDAVEVVRCKDCVSHNFCKFEQYLGLDGFCSYGGRKEDETD